MYAYDNHIKKEQTDSNPLCFPITISVTMMTENMELLFHFTILLIANSGEWRYM